MFSVLSECAVGFSCCCGLGGGGGGGGGDSDRNDIGLWFRGVQAIDGRVESESDDGDDGRDDTGVGKVEDSGVGSMR
jgi:hypothetical protein